MTREWVEHRKVELSKKAGLKEREIVAKINAADFLSDSDKSSLICAVKKDRYEEYGSHFLNATLKLMDNADLLKLMQLEKELDLRELTSLQMRSQYGANRYLDSEPVQFDGDIIITDPCYIIRRDSSGNGNRDDWNICGCGDNMATLGIKNSMVRDTLYGDWSCTVFNTDTEEAIGDFCADAGMVAVFPLDEVLKYNPEFNYHTERTWTTALIKNFKGTVQFVVEHEEGVFEDDTEWHKAGDKWEDFSVHVVGHGVNTKTGEPINFSSSQTGL